MLVLTTIYKRKNEAKPKKIQEFFNSEREARETFNQTVRYYVSCHNGYEYVSVSLPLNGGVALSFEVA